jgi:hypothetical protein
MTPSTREPRLPGRLLVKLARLIFEEPALSTVVTPALADLQQEVREAGESHTRRLGARVRGYVAFWKLVVAAPIMLPGTSLGGPLTTLLLGRSGGSAPALLVPMLFVAIWPMFGSFVLAATAGGILLAIVLRRWHDRYPSTLAPADPLARRPAAEINLSSIPVAGDIGGLIFVVGSFVIILLGLPDIRWFVASAMVAATVLAGSLFAWRSSHPSALSGGNSILLR